MTELFAVLCSLLAAGVALLAPIAALVSVVRLRRTVGELERRVAELEARGPAKAASEAGVSWGGGAAPETPPPGGQAPRDPPRVAEPDGVAQPGVAARTAGAEATRPDVASRTAGEGAVEPDVAARTAGAGLGPVSPDGQVSGEVPVEPTRGASVEPPQGGVQGEPPSRPPPVEPPRIPPPPRRRIGADTLGVWALAIPGGLALALAAIFALREAIAAGLVGPGVRFAIGAAVGAFALLSSELARARRYEVPAAALGGGGAAVVYAVLYAGHARYGLLGQELAFGLMVVTTAVTLFAAERRNSRFMAVLALGGGYLTPILLSTGENKAVAFFGYLALLDAGLLWAATRRQWTTLIALAGVVTAGLYLGWVATYYAADQVLVGLAAPAVLGGLFLSLPARRATALPEAVAGGAAALLLLVAAAPYLIPIDPLRQDPVSALPLVAPPGDAPWIAAAWLVVTTTVVLVAGRRRGGAWLDGAGAVVGALLLAAFALGWSFVEAPPWGAIAVGTAALPVVGVVTGTLAWIVPIGGVGLTLLVAAGAADAPMGLVAGIAALLAVLGALAGARTGPRALLVPAAALAALPILAPLAREYEADAGGAWFLGAAVVYAAFAFPPFWRPRAGDLWGALSAAVAGPLVFFPLHRIWLETFGDDVIGVLPVLLGVTTMLAAVTLARAVKVRADDRELAILVAVVLLFAALAVPLQLSEAWLTVGWAVEVALLAALSRRLTHPVIPVFAGLLAAAVSVRLLLNPDALAYGGGEGWIVLNWTLYTWGVPGVCLLVAARLFGKPPWFVTALRTAAVLVFFALVNLEVAHAFAHDDMLSFTSEDLAESMTRSIAWASYGLLLIVVGTIRDARGARLAGLVFALLGALKVFAVDLWDLSGLARVGAFAGLAVTLLVGAIAFQRIVLKDRKP